MGTDFIEFDGVSKRYVLGQRLNARETLMRDRLPSAAAAP